MDVFPSNAKRDFRTSHRDKNMLRILHFTLMLWSHTKVRFGVRFTRYAASPWARSTVS